MSADKEWLATLKVGDQVTTNHGDQWYGYRFHTIERMTATQFILDDTCRSRVRRSDGHILGASYRDIAPITDKVLAVNETVALQSWLNSLHTNDRKKMPPTSALRAMKAAYDEVMKEVPCTAPQP